MRGDFIANLHGSAESVREVCLKVREIEHLDRPRQQGLAQAIKSCYAWVFLVLGAKNFLRHEGHLLITNRLHCRDVHHCEDRITFDVRVTQGDTVARVHACFCGQVNDWHGEK